MNREEHLENKISAIEAEINRLISKINQLQLENATLYGKNLKLEERLYSYS